MYKNPLAKSEVSLTILTCHAMVTFKHIIYSNDQKSVVVEMCKSLEIIIAGQIEVWGRLYKACLA